MLKVLLIYCSRLKYILMFCLARGREQVLSELYVFMWSYSLELGLGLKPGTLLQEVYVMIHSKTYKAEELLMCLKIIIFRHKLIISHFRVFCLQLTRRIVAIVQPRIGVHFKGDLSILNCRL